MARPHFRTIRIASNATDGDHKFCQKGPSQRSKPWLVGVTMAFMILIVAATVIIASST